MKSVHLQSCKNTRETPHAIHSPEGLIMKTFFCLLSLDLNFPMGKKKTTSEEPGREERITVKIKLHIVTCFLLASSTFHAALSIQHVAPAKLSHYRPGQPLWGFRKFRLPELLDNRHMKVVRFSVLRTGRLCLPRDTRGTHFC